jgi:hypothetical protein
MALVALQYSSLAFFGLEKDALRPQHGQEDLGACFCLLSVKESSVSI